jgi:hypothetical protein
MRSLLALLLVLVLVSPVLAQTPTATLVGNIKDASGGVVPGATITVRNTATNIGRTAQSDESGAYTVLSLAPGPYEVTAQIPGFKEVRTLIRLTVGEARRVDLTLEPGQVTEVIEVIGRAPINTERATIGQVIDNKRIVEMPLNGRNFYQLATLAPGAISVPSGANLTRSNFVSVYLGGTRARKTAFYLDGIDITETQFGGTYIVPSPDALQEFRVQTNSLSAEYGRAGGNLNISMRSGTNEYRGSAYEFFRDDSAAAKNFFSTGKDPLSRHQFGATLGGPLVKNKTFFFVSVEGTRQKRGQTLNLRAPTEDMKKGIFPFTVRDPFSTPSANFPGNQVPANRISPAARYFLQYLANANGVDSSGRPVYQASPVQHIDQEQYHVRIDEHLNDSNIFFARYSHMDLGQTDPTRSPALGDYPEQKVRAQNAGIGHTLIMGNGMLNELRIGYNRSHLFFHPLGEGTNHTVQAGIRGFDETTLHSQNQSFPDILITSYVDLQGLAQDQRPKRNRIEHWQVSDGLSLVRGRHAMKVGVDYRHQKATFIVGNRAQGEFFFNGNWTGDPFADFLLGLPSRVRRAYPLDLFGVYDDFFGAYAQDDWKVTRDLTLNVGLRWESNPFYKGIRNQMTAFDFATGQIIMACDCSDPSGIDMDAQQVTRKIFPTYKDILVTSSSRGLPISVRPVDRKDWAPRLGLAWRPFGSSKAVVRAGYGVFYEFADTNFPNSYAKVPPFVFNEDLSISQTGTPRRFLTDPFLGVAAGAAGSIPTLLTSAVDLRNSYSEQWNVAYQRELFWHMTGEVAYVGQKGHRQELNQNFNDAPPSTSSANLQARRPYPRFGPSTKGTFEASSSYHALQTKVERQVADGLIFLASYTWAKSIDNSSNDLGGSADQSDLEYNRGVSDNDVTHRFVGSFVYSLPWGRDKIWGDWQLSGILVVQSGLPFTVGISSDRANIGRTGQRPDVRVVNGQPLSPSVDKPTIDQWFDTRVFALPAVGTFGNVGRNTLRGPGLETLDLALAKNFKIRKETSLQLRVEAFNALNHPNFGRPTATMSAEVPLDAPVGDPRRTPNRFGTITSAGDPRIIQFGARLVF